MAKILSNFLLLRYLKIFYNSVAELRLYSLLVEEVCYITCFPMLLFFELMPNLRLTKVNGIIVCQVIHLKS